MTPPEQGAQTMNIGEYSVQSKVISWLLIVIMVGAIGLVHAKNGWDVMKGGMEFQVLMLAVGIYFAAKGNEA